MQWVSKVVRGADRQLKLEVESAEGTQQLDIADLPGRLEVAGTERRYADIDLASARRLTSHQFVLRLGRSDIATGNQPVYEADVNGVTWLVPAQLLIFAVFGSCRPLRAKMFSTLPFDDATQAIHLLIPGRPGLAPLMGWLQQDHHAVRAWASVYRHALSGRLDFACPSAKIRVRADGIYCDGQFLVTELHVLELSSQACGSPTSPTGDSFSASVDRHHVWRSTAVTGEPQLKHWAPETRLSDTQWAELEEEFHGVAFSGIRGARAKHDSRALVDITLLKLSGPYSWKEVPGDKALSKRASALFGRFRKTGLIARAVAIVERGHSS